MERAATGILTKMGLALVRAYQVILSPILPPACRFEPTCSHYMQEALAEKGFVKGAAKGVWRICRCHPFSKGGFDPVR